MFGTHLIPQSNIFRYYRTVNSGFVAGGPAFRHPALGELLFVLASQARADVFLQHSQALFNASDLVITLNINQLDQLSHYLRPRIDLAGFSAIRNFD